MMEKGKRIVNKIKNAGIFLDKQETGGIRPDIHEEWEQSKKLIDSSLDQFDWSSDIKELSRYFWGVFCDKRIEESKKISPCNETLRIIYSELLIYFEIFLGKIKLHCINGQLPLP